VTEVADTLGRLARELRGCRGAFAIVFDGLPLEAVWTGAAGADLDAIGAEFAAVLREARQAAQDLGLGPLRGLSVRAQGPTMIFRCGPDSLLVAVLDRSASAAAARRALAEAAREGLTAL
jgi:predicted regulator of Ras-like GTPase activity (Roadblock/LC7/MglB family)